jgi:hypothetical protein
LQALAQLTASALAPTGRQPADIVREALGSGHGDEGGEGEEIVALRKEILDLQEALVAAKTKALADVKRIQVRARFLLVTH